MVGWKPRASSGTLFFIPLSPFRLSSQSSLLLSLSLSSSRYTTSRYSVAADKQATLLVKAHLESGRYEIKESNALVLADTLKIWLRELAEPLVPQVLYESCLKVADEKSSLVSFCVKNFPPAHLYTLDYLIRWLKKLASFSKQNQYVPVSVSVSVLSLFLVLCGSAACCCPCCCSCCSSCCCCCSSCCVTICCCLFGCTIQNAP